MKALLTIALDAMGGDNAPRIVVRGANMARKRYPDVHFRLFGDERKIAPLLKRLPKLRRVIANLRRILAIEWVAAARSVELRQPLQPADGTGAAVRLLRSRVPGPGPDRVLSPELVTAEELLAVEALVKAVEAVTGRLA